MVVLLTSPAQPHLQANSSFSMSFLRVTLKNWEWPGDEVSSTMVRMYVAPSFPYHALTESIYALTCVHVHAMYILVCV